jgi:carboxyl-terminal processing protease
MQVVWRSLGAGLIMTSLAACVAPFPPELNAENQERVAEVFANSYEEVIDNYVDRIAASDLAAAGLGKMTELDPAMSLQADAQEFSLSLNGETFHRFASPAADDVDGWANAVAAALIDARSHSARLRAHSETRLFEDHMRGVAAGLPRPGTYSTDEEIRAWLFPQYNSGVSFSFLSRKGELIVWRLDPDGHLEAAGLKAGDVVTHVDFLPVTDMTVGEMRQRLIGPEGSELTFTVRRGGQDSPIIIKVARWKIQPVGAHLDRRGDVGILRMPSMTFQAIRDVAYRIETNMGMGKRGSVLPAGWILDLRGNLGSTEWVYRRLANIFLGKGNIAVQRSYRETPKMVINASWPDSSDNRPLVVLVDGLTSYGAEEVVAALQDNGRAIVIGSSTVGYGVVSSSLSLYNLGDIRVPVALSYAPSGYAFEGRGVLPDICIAGGQGSVEGWLAALRRGEGLTTLEDRTRQIGPHDEAALAAHRALCPLEPDPETFDPAEPLSQSGDLAESLALAILNEPDLYKRLVRPSPGLN